MASFESILFLIQFLGVLGIFIYKLYNIFSAGENEYKTIFLTFITQQLLWGVGLLISIVYYYNTLYIVLFNLEAWLMPFFWLLFIVELMLKFGIINPKNDTRARAEV